MNKEELIERIKYIRKRAKLTQKELSEKLGVNKAYINRLESKKDFAPSFEVLMQLIELCGSTPEEFFYHDIEEYKKDSLVIETLKGTYSIEITAKDKESVLALAKQFRELDGQILVSRLNSAFGEGFATLKKDDKE